MQYKDGDIWKRIARLWSGCVLEPPIDSSQALERGMHGLMNLLGATHGRIRLRLHAEAAEGAGAAELERLDFASEVASAEPHTPKPTRTLSTTLAPADSVEAIVELSRSRTAGAYTRADEQVLELVTDGLVGVFGSYLQMNGLLPHQTRLDARERRVVTLLAGGHCATELAKMLEIDPGCVEQVIDDVLDKLGVDSRFELLHLVMSCPQGVERRREVDGPTETTTKTEPQPAPDPFLERVLDAIRIQLHAEHLTTQTVARRLGVSKRTLQRKLAAADTSFREVTDRARHKRALELLAKPSVDYTDVAHQLGYGQVSSLNRALQRWTGETPSEVRAELRGRR